MIFEPTHGEKPHFASDQIVTGWASLRDLEWQAAAKLALSQGPCQAPSLLQFPLGTISAILPIILTLPVFAASDHYFPHAGHSDLLFTTEAFVFSFKGVSPILQLRTLRPPKKLSLLVSHESGSKTSMDSTQSGEGGGGVSVWQGVMNKHPLTILSFLQPCCPPGAKSLAACCCSDIRRAARVIPLGNCPCSPPSAP